MIVYLTNKGDGQLKKNKKVMLLSITVILLLIIALFFVINLEQKTYEQIWLESFGSEKSDEGYYILSTDDGGCLALGYTTTNSGDKDIYLIKTDENGNKKWEKNYGSNGHEYGKAIIKVDDGYVIAGNSNSTGSVEYDYDAWLIKIDFNGTEMWNYTYGGNGVEEVNSLLENSDKNYILTGSASSYGNPEGDLWILEVEKTGKNIIWNNTYGGNSFDEGRSIIETDNGYVVAGQTKSYAANKYSDAWLLKIDRTGDHMWNYTYGSDYNDLFNQLLQSDDGFIMIGHTLEKTQSNEDKWNGYIVNTDINGIEKWTRTISEEKDTGISCIQETNSGYILLGYTGKYGEDDVLIEKIDKQGNRVWIKTIDGDYSDAGIWIDKGLNDNYFVTGYTDTKGTGFTDLWVMKLLIN